MKNSRIALKTSFIVVLFASLILSFPACNRNEQALPETDSVRLAIEMVYYYTTTSYLWEEYVPGGIDINSYSDPYNLFEDMRYKPYDRWSGVTDDYTGMMASLTSGVRKASGFRAQRMSYNGGSNIYLAVEFVYEDGTAYAAGLRRGDIIISIDGTKLTENNYSELLGQDNLALGMGELQGEQVVDLSKTINVTKVEQSFNPILQSKIIETGGKKIGYFLYDQFIPDYETELVNVFQDFNSQGIDELVLDLRYNPGGYANTCALLASMIVPAIHQSGVFLTQQWNAGFTEYFESLPNNEGDNYLFLNFPTPDVNLNMNKVYVLTSSGSASASEAIICGLKPYMNVTLIGETTHGKYTGAIPFGDTEEPARHNWGIYLVVNRYANVDGLTDFVDGFTPDYAVQDDYTTPLGDVTEPLLAKAIELITGVVKKSTYQLPEQFEPQGPIYDTPLEEEGMMTFENFKHLKK
jgi:carboxyl-terminal processing protease